MAVTDAHNTPAERLPPLHALRAFEAAGRHLSFSRAADELGVSPAAVSQQIQQMEEFAGQPLFKRLTRRVELTDAGAAALPLAREAMALFLEASRVMRLPLRQRRVSISVAPSFAGKWLVPRLDNFKDLQPDLEVWVLADMAISDLAVADIDLAIRYGPGGYPELNSELLLRESVTPVCSPSLLDGDGRLSAPADLERFSLLHDESADRDPSCPTWPMWLAARGLDHVDGRRGTRVNQSSLAIEAAIAGKGVALAKRQLAAADIAAGRLVAPFESDDQPVNFAYWLIWRKGRTVSPGLKALMDWLRLEAAGGEADPGAGI
jgi:LysR family transcriptional regulator, glycine cleavage system transcriptional activator